MTLATDWQLTQPIIDQYVALFAANVPGAISAYNATPRGAAYPLDSIAQTVDYLPPPSILMGGCPIIGIGEGGGPSRVEDDLVHEAQGCHPLLINAYAQSSDHAALVHQLRGYMVVLLNVINTDRRLGASAVLAAQPAQVWSTRILGVQPGAALDLVNPDAPQESPRSWLSWAGILIECRRTEVE